MPVAFDVFWPRVAEVDVGLVVFAVVKIERFCRGTGFQRVPWIGQGRGSLGAGVLAIGLVYRWIRIIDFTYLWLGSILPTSNTTLLASLACKGIDYVYSRDPAGPRILGNGRNAEQHLRNREHL